MIQLIQDLAEPSKRQLLEEMRTGPKSVTELVEATGMKQPNVSNHLAKLRVKGIVRAHKIGRQVFYSLGGPAVEAALLQFTDRASSDLSARLPLGEVSRQYARAAVASDESGCTRIVDQLIQQGVPLLRIYQQVLGQAMDWVGKWYQVEAIDIGHEHAASAITERMMARVVHYAPPVRNTSKTALIGCVAGNWHTIGPRMISDYLRLSGWKTVYLGANVPSASFIAGVREHNPHLVLLSCALDGNRAATVEAIQGVRNLRGNDRALIIGVGGRRAMIDPDDFTSAGADFVVENLRVFAEDVVPLIEDGRDLPQRVF